MQQARLYEQVQRETSEGRELEATVLFRAAQKLNQCAHNWENRDTKEFGEKLAEALEFNQKLWSFLQVELSNPDHPLPEALRLNLLRLSSFIDKQLFALFAGGGTKEDLLSIARIDEQIAQGLQTTPVDSRPAQSEDTPTPTKLVDVTG